MRRSVLALAAAVTLLPATAARAAEGDIIVQRAPGLDSGERRELRAEAGVKLVSELSVARTELVKPKDGDVAEALEELRADEDVVLAEPDQRVTASLLPNDYYWPDLWGLQSNVVDALQAWERSRGENVTVAVADSGVNPYHVDLIGQIASGGYDFVDNDFTPQDESGHGTHVAGTIAARGLNGFGIIGLAPEAKILPLRVLKGNTGFMSDVAEAFDYAGKRGVRIVNASLGGGPLTVLRNVIASYPETLFVIAAGNEAADNDKPASASYPCAYPEPNIVCVSASDDKDALAEFSNFGAKTVDLAAPGVDILSAWRTSPVAYVWASGTSMAAPHVAGAAALALAAAPKSKAFQLKWALLSSVDSSDGLAGTSVSGGRLDAAAAVAAITSDAVPTKPPEPEPTPVPPAVTTQPPVTPQPPAVNPPAPPAQPAPPASQPPAATPTPTPDPGAVLSKLAISGSLRSAKSKLKVRFSLTRPATVRFTITRRGSKRALSSWRKRGRAGVNRLSIARRLPTGKTLRRGTYRLSLALSGTAKTSRTIRVR